MRKLKFLIAALLAVLCVSLFPLGTRAEAAPKEYYLGGMTAGFSLSAGGTEVIGLSEVRTAEGVRRPAEDAGVRAGDLLVAADGIRIRTISELSAALERSGGKEIVFVVKRNGETAEVPILPAKDLSNGKFKIGVLIRDSLSGIGTVTYIDGETRRFGALGHGICDEGNNQLGLSDPKVYLCSVVGVNRGKRGRAGELRGIFMGDRVLASADTVCDSGLYGTFDAGYDLSGLERAEAASSDEATIGRAEILSTIDGVEPKRYEISIVKVDTKNRDRKNFVIKVTDERLIEETGGIVQGMSGSPILQNGKLIGAVTHVFVNDPTRGYGIGIENMLGN